MSLISESEIDGEHIDVLLKQSVRDIQSIFNSETDPREVVYHAN